MVQNVYNCDFSSKISKRYLRFISSFKNHGSYVTRSKYVWKNCFSHDRKNVNCYDSTYQRDKCLDAKVRFIKTVRLRGTKIEKLLKENINLKIIILMRDPRGIMKSRTDHDWWVRQKTTLQQCYWAMPTDGAGFGNSCVIKQNISRPKDNIGQFFRVPCWMYQYLYTKLRSQRINFDWSVSNSKVHVYIWEYIFLIVIFLILTGWPI